MFNIIAILIFSLGISITLGYFFTNFFYKSIKKDEKDNIKLNDSKKDLNV